MTTVAAFDLDGTITDRDCVVPFLREVAGTWTIATGLAMRPVHVGGALVRRDRDTIKAAAARAAFRNRRVDSVMPIAADFAAIVHREWIRPEALEQIVGPPRRGRRDRDRVGVVRAVRPTAGSAARRRRRAGDAGLDDQRRSAHRRPGRAQLSGTGEGPPACTPGSTSTTVVEVRWTWSHTAIRPAIGSSWPTRTCPLGRGPMMYRRPPMSDGGAAC